MNLNNSGVQFLMKAMGVDPAILAEKAQEFETLAKQFGTQIASDVHAMNTRLGNIETSLLELHNKLDAIANGGTYAGPSSLHLLEAGHASEQHATSVTSVVDTTSHTQEKQHHGRTTSVNRTHRSNRKAS